MNETDFFSQLNREQQEAIIHTEGPSMVIAGAGSGKTRVLTYKIAWLLKKGVDPFNILALTFTNKAAKEMKERVEQLVGNTEARNVWLGTFHSIFARMLRIESHLIGFPPNFTIYDKDDSKGVIKSIIKELDIDPKSYSPDLVMHRISSSKTNMITATQYVNNGEIMDHDKKAGKARMGEIFTHYQQRLLKSFAMDFDDILLYTYDILDKNPSTLLKYQNKFKYILVDEYQDTNGVQYLILKKLAARYENICVVGDDAQSIYSFRGANIRNILNFKNDYPDYSEFKLEQNYRSTKTIVSAANSIIKNNREQIFKTIWTDNDQGSAIKIMRAISDNEEGNLIANTIFEYKVNEHLQNSDFAVLYRTNAQSRTIEEALRRLNIPYKIYGGLSFYKRKEIKDLFAYFRLAINHYDNEALQRIINYPARGIGKTTMESIIAKAGETNKSLWEIIENPDEYKLALNQGTLKKISEFVNMIKSFSVEIKQKNAYEIAKKIAASSGILKELYNDNTPEGISKYENVEELLNGIKEFSESESQINMNYIEEKDFLTNTVRTLDEFMLDIALLTDADDKNEDNNKNNVSLMTIHGAKGLEFPYVFISGLEENLFPSILSMSSRSEIEEERRLFYVALTRAKKKLFLSYCESRYRYGELVSCQPSRFLDEIDKRFIETQGGYYNEKIKNQYNDNNSLKSFTNKAKAPSNFVKKEKIINKEEKFATEDDPKYITEGMTVEHQWFGKGKVLKIEGDGSNKKARVLFETVGEKQLLLKFAKLLIVR